ncbi:cytochrome C [Sulfurifustis variabilis]|uniref:Cytochrome C n=2 Tax=Sulfurifustis variabilis TaxID=1675686 RepID=A0A1B4V3P0_9GAMM|nr:cytochrome C [Sulfurifustis variabilis]
MQARAMRRRTRVARRTSAATALVLALVGCATDERAAQTSLSGEQVYRETCSACHATGVANAPRLGDRKAWAPLVEEGQAVLTAHAWVGVRAMPPGGGRPDLSLLEFGRAAAYMARAAGERWEDPDAEMLERIREEEEKRVEELRAKKESGTGS